MAGHLVEALGKDIRLKTGGGVVIERVPRTLRGYACARLCHGSSTCLVSVCSPRLPLTGPVSHLCRPRLGHVPNCVKFILYMDFLPLFSSVFHAWLPSGGAVGVLSRFSGTCGGAVGGFSTSGSGEVF